MMWSKFAEVQCAFAIAEVQKVTANLLQTCGFAFAEHLLQFCGICGCGIECKFAVPSSGYISIYSNAYIPSFLISPTVSRLFLSNWFAQAVCH